VTIRPRLVEDRHLILILVSKERKRLRIQHERRARTPPDPLLPAQRAPRLISRFRTGWPVAALVVRYDLSGLHQRQPVLGGRVDERGEFPCAGSGLELFDERSAERH
jgi:hypothetical protein